MDSVEVGHRVENVSLYYCVWSFFCNNVKCFYMLLQKYKILWPFFLHKSSLTLLESSPLSSRPSICRRSTELAPAAQLYLLQRALHVVTKATFLSI